MNSLGIPIEIEQLCLGPLNQTLNDKQALLILPAWQIEICALFTLKNFRNARVLFLSYRLDILAEAERIFRLVFGKDVSIGFLDATRKDFDAQILLATPQMIRRYLDLTKPNGFSNNTFKLLICTQAQYGATNLFQPVLDYFQAYTHMLGYTDSPWRSDKGNFLKWFGKRLIGEVSFEQAYVDEWLKRRFKYRACFDALLREGKADVETLDVDETGEVALQTVRVRSKELHGQKRLSGREGVIKRIILEEMREIVGKYGHCRTVLYCQNQDEAEAWAQQLGGTALHDKTKDYRVLFEAFQESEQAIVTVVGKLYGGVYRDLKIDMIVLLQFTEERRRILWGLTPWLGADNTNPLRILDFVDTDRHLSILRQMDAEVREIVAKKRSTTGPIPREPAVVLETDERTFEFESVDYAIEIPTQAKDLLAQSISVELSTQTSIPYSKSHKRQRIEGFVQDETSIAAAFAFKGRTKDHMREFAELLASFQRARIVGFVEKKGSRYDTFVIVQLAHASAGNYLQDFAKFLMAIMGLVKITIPLMRPEKLLEGDEFVAAIIDILPKATAQVADGSHGHNKQNPTIPTVPATTTIAKPGTELAVIHQIQGKVELKYWESDTGLLMVLLYVAESDILEARAVVLKVWETVLPSLQIAVGMSNRCLTISDSSIVFLTSPNSLYVLIDSMTRMLELAHLAVEPTTFTTEELSALRDSRAFKKALLTLTNISGRVRGQLTLELGESTDNLPGRLDIHDTNKTVLWQWQGRMGLLMIVFPVDDTRLEDTRKLVLGTVPLEFQNGLQGFYVDHSDKTIILFLTRAKSFRMLRGKVMKVLQQAAIALDPRSFTYGQALQMKTGALTGLLADPSLPLDLRVELQQELESNAP